MAGNAERLIEVRFLSDPQRLKLLRSVVRDAAGAVGFRQEDIDGIVLAVNEACMNVIQHAYRGRQDGEIRLEICSTGKALVFRLRDDAPCVDAGKVTPRDLGDIRPGGLGVHFINKIMDESAFLDCGREGNLFQMVKYIEPQR